LKTVWRKGEAAMPDYLVYRGETQLGSLTRIEGDLPWHRGTFAPTAAFMEVRPLFDRERELLDADRIEEWGKVWDEIAAPGLRLMPLDGREPITEFLLHIEDRQAWWRY
jgi:hypothetical protein